MNINIDWDLGNVWDMMSAIGTVGAVAISLYFTWRAHKKNNKPIQGMMMYSQHEYMGFLKGPEPGGLIEGVSKKDAITIKFEGRMRFYNPSDEPKSLTNLNIAVTYDSKEGNLITSLPILQEEKEYISLSPKETRVIDYEVYQSINDFPKDDNEPFYNVKDYELNGSNDNLEAQNFKLTV